MAGLFGVKYHSYSMRTVNADTRDEAAGVFAGRISRKRLGRLARWTYEHVAGSRYIVHPVSKRSPNVKPINYHVS